MKAEDKLLKGLPNDIPAKLTTYATNNISILKPDQFIVNFEACFEHYHFSAPTVTPPPLLIDKKLHSFKANRLIAINPEQTIMATCNVLPKEYTALFVNKNFLQETAYAITGKSDVSFVQDNHIFSKKLNDSFNSFVSEFTSMSNASTLMLDSISTQIAIQLLRDIQSNISNKISEKKYTEKSYVSKAMEFINEYYNSDISLNDLCKFINLSPYHFIRIFKEETGKTPHEYILDLKIQKALELINNNRYSIGEVAQQCGFVNQSHFNIAFKKIVGVNPTIYKKSL